jgi:hypothetical protein
MDPEEHERAEARFSRALSEAEARDPREYYRTRLRELRDRDPDAYERAVRHYGEVLVPSIASGEAEPLAAWLEYGRMIASSTETGRTVAIDAAGGASDYAPPVAPDRLVLHLPENERVKALPVGLPARMTPAQQATYDLLVAGKQKMATLDEEDA